MLEIRAITKTYVTGETAHHALDGVSLTLRDNEFVSVLGPSGSGKTTLLNVIGGLDHYDSGDLIIDGVSTKGYTDRDWDAYRNHRIGFVFQSYNLIPHQSVRANVELALTISGISGDERRRRAEEALVRVGLKDHMDKRPAQLSGGQMQRVAIARALVNNPDVVLADEPTGALDTETSVQIMELLKEVANDRLVVMVTHNPDLAEAYSTRIVRLRDGCIIDDSNPLDARLGSDPKRANGEADGKGGGKARRANMSFATSLALSFNNLRTKIGRTALTAFAGSIGIIGVALVMALSSGLNGYIEDTQAETMGHYPVTINSETVDLGSLMGSGGGFGSARSGGAVTGTTAADTDAAANADTQVADGVSVDYSALEAESRAERATTENDLTAFKAYLESDDCEIDELLGTQGIVYSYPTSFVAYARNEAGELIATDADAPSTSSTTEDVASAGESGAMGPAANMSRMNGLMAGGTSGAAENFAEITPKADGTGISDDVTDAYDVAWGSWPTAPDEVVLVTDEDGSLPAETLYQLGLMSEDEYLEAARSIEDGESASTMLDYEEACSRPLSILAVCDMFADQGDGLFAAVETDEARLEAYGRELTIVGVIRPRADTESASLSAGIGYTRELTEWLIDHTDESAVVQAQEAAPETDVLTGIAFADESTTYADNMETFGRVDRNAPSSISIYANGFEAKESVIAAIGEYNNRVPEDERISYTDYSEILTSSVTSIVNIISYVLIAFMAVSLVVSSVMIGIITRISVLERTKEIGILRALGASKGNVTQVFNAETVIIGLLAGVLGVGVSMLLCIPVNAVIQNSLGFALTASLPAMSAVALIALSVVVTVAAGIIPARGAAKMDPVEALRSE